MSERKEIYDVDTGVSADTPEARGQDEAGVLGAKISSIKAGIRAAIAPEIAIGKRVFSAMDTGIVRGRDGVFADVELDKLASMIPQTEPVIKRYHVADLEVRPESCDGTEDVESLLAEIARLRAEVAHLTAEAEARQWQPFCPHTSKPEPWDDVLVVTWRGRVTMAQIIVDGDGCGEFHEKGGGGIEVEYWMELPVGPEG